MKSLFVTYNKNKLNITFLTALTPKLSIGKKQMRVEKAKLIKITIGKQKNKVKTILKIVVQKQIRKIVVTYIYKIHRLENLEY